MVSSCTTVLSQDHEKQPGSGSWSYNERCDLRTITCLDPFIPDLLIYSLCLSSMSAQYRSYFLLIHHWFIILTFIYKQINACTSYLFFILACVVFSLNTQLYSLQVTASDKFTRGFFLTKGKNNAFFLDLSHYFQLLSHGNFLLHANMLCLNYLP